MFRSFPKEITGAQNFKSSLPRTSCTSWKDFPHWNVIYISSSAPIAVSTLSWRNSYRLASLGILFIHTHYSPTISVPTAASLQLSPLFFSAFQISCHPLRTPPKCEGLLQDETLARTPSSSGGAQSFHSSQFLQRLAQSKTPLRAESRPELSARANTELHNQLSLGAMAAASCRLGECLCPRLMSNVYQRHGIG